MTGSWLIYVDKSCPALTNPDHKNACAAMAIAVGTLDRLGLVPNGRETPNRMPKGLGILPPVRSEIDGCLL